MPTQYVSKLCTTVATKMTCPPLPPLPPPAAVDPAIGDKEGGGGGVQTSDTGAVLLTLDVWVTAELAEAPHETPCRLKGKFLFI